MVTLQEVTHVGKKSQEQRVEELSQKVGGRFHLTSLIQKQLEQYHTGGRAFMPDVRNLNELFEMVLDQIEEEQIGLAQPETEAINPLTGE